VVFYVVTPKGSGNPVVTFIQDGEKLTGQYSGSIGEAPLTGTLKGKDLVFSVLLPIPKKDPRFTQARLMVKQCLVPLILQALPKAHGKQKDKIESYLHDLRNTKTDLTVINY